MADETATLEKVRKLLAKAEAEGVTPPEAEALTAKATELMAKYGIDQAMINAARPGADMLANRKIDIENPWAMVRIHLLNGVFGALRCKVIQLNHPGNGARVHVFGYQSDMDRAELLYTSLLVQMARSLAAQRVPVSGGHAKRWRRSWMLGFISEVTKRIETAEQRATVQAAASETVSGPGTALVLRDRSLAVRTAFRQEYPRVRTATVKCGVSGYGQGGDAGRSADIGGARVGAGATAAIGR